MGAAEKQTLFSTTLGCVADFQNGGAWKESEYVDSGVPVTRVTNCQSGTVDLSGCKYLSFSSAKKYERHRLIKGDLIVATVGSHPTQPGSVVGRTSTVPESASGSLLNQNAVRLRAKSGLLDQRYLTYLASSKEFRDYIIAHARGAASQVRMSIELLRDMPLLLPPLPTQQLVASFLSVYDDLIENNTRRIEILEETARRLYEEWFVQFRFPGHEGVEFKDSELGLIPEGWVVSCLGDIAEEIREAVHPSSVSPDTPYIGLEHLPRRSITLREWGSADSVSSGKLLFRRGDVLFGKIRPYFHKVVIAPFSGICSSDTILIRPKKDTFLGVVLCCSSSDKFVDYATQTSNGTKMPRADWKVLKNYPVLIPSGELLSDFNGLVLGLVNQARNLMLKNVNLRAQRDLLLPKLISGEIDVSDIPMPT